jgi:hypothetical protein
VLSREGYVGAWVLLCRPRLTMIAMVTTSAVLFSRCCWLEVKCRQDGWVSGPKPVTRLQHSNKQQLENQTTYVLTKRYRRELLMMGIIVPETC